MHTASGPSGPLDLGAEIAVPPLEVEQPASSNSTQVQDEAIWHTQPSPDSGTPHRCIPKTD